MRTIQVVVGFDVHKAGEHIEVDDQVACDAIAQGYAVPSVYTILSATENRAIDGAPEAQ